LKLKSKSLPGARRALALVLLLALAACSLRTPSATQTPTAVLPTPQAFTTRTPDVQSAAQAFLEAWKAEDYAAMYGLLSAASQAAIPQEQFIQRYADVANEAGMVALTYQIGNLSNRAPEGEVDYTITLQSAIVGDITRSMKMPLTLEGGSWKVAWNDGLILPELAGGNYLKMDSGQSKRSTIFDRGGNPIAQQADAVSLGLWPDYVNLKEDAGLVIMMGQLINRRYDTIANWIENALPGAYIPMGEVPAEQAPKQVERLSQWGAAVVSQYSRRLYYGNGVAPHLTGYVSPIQEEEVPLYRRKGYPVDQRVGRKGLELWGEETLAGKPGGTLYVFSPDGRALTQVGEVAAEPGQDIYTTIDRDFQGQVQLALSGFRGAAVVIEMNTGRVLAIASSPGFDPNAYEIENFNWQTELSEIVNNPDSPQFNRASQGQYPLGSVFKLITISAALESQRYTAESQYDCQYAFEELPGFTRYDWTWEHFQNDEVTQPSGVLTLPQGLIRSCNPWFWHIGLDLYRVGLPNAISDMARGFGLGSKTGVAGIDEEPGNIPDPASDVDAINNAIGQGDTLVTPLQVARFVAALGNGGTLYRPQIIEKIAPPNGSPTFSFQPEAQGKLPLKPENLALIQEAMKGVVSSKKPLGTAWLPMSGLDIPVAGKTGTAEAPAGDSHAWFAGFTYANREDKPDIAIAVLTENAGEGSVISAPIFRRIVEIYFFGKPIKLYRWEAIMDVTKTPTEPITDTPEGQQPGNNRPTRPPNINP